MSKPPPIPKEQRPAGPKADAEQRRVPAETEGLSDRRDQLTNVQTGHRGDAEVNTDQQGRFGDIKQNTTHQGYQQDR